MNRLIPSTLVAVVIGCGNPVVQNPGEVQVPSDPVIRILDMLDRPNEWKNNTFIFPRIKHSSGMQITVDASSKWLRIDLNGNDITHRFTGEEKEIIWGKAYPLAKNFVDEPDRQKRAAADKAFNEMFGK